MTPDARFEAGIFAFLVAHVLYITAATETGGLDVGAGVAAAVLTSGSGSERYHRSSPGPVRRSRHPDKGDGLHTGDRRDGGAGGRHGGADGDDAEALLLTSDALLGWNRPVDRPGWAGPRLTNHAAQVGFVLWLTG